MPLLNAICIGSFVMLLRNFIVEYNLINGAIRIIHDILYTEYDGPNNQIAIPEYDFVEFKYLIIPND